MAGKGLTALVTGASAGIGVKVSCLRSRLTAFVPRTTLLRVVRGMQEPAEA